MRTLPLKSTDIAPQQQAVLVLEDDESLLVLIAEILTQQGYFPVGCSFADMAETVHLQEHVACIILDLGLTDRNDTTLLKSLSHHPDYIETPIIVHTGRALDVNGKAEVMRYADCLIDKGPESIPALMRELRRLACFYKFAVHSSLNLDAGIRRY